MNTQINLVPLEILVSPKEIKLKKTAYKIILYITSILVFILVLMLIVFLFYKIILDRQKAELATIKENIAILEQSEQKLFLAKDTLEKIAPIFNKRSPLIQLDNLLSLNQEVVAFSLEQQILESKLNFNESSKFTSFFDTLTSLTGYKNITMKSFESNYNGGYLVKLLLEN